MMGKKIIDVGIAIKLYNDNNPEKKQLNQKILSEKVGNNKQMFSEWKKNFPKTMDFLLKVSEVTGCPIDKMIINTNQTNE